MSRINTRILRVPGTTSGQIDERPIGSFNAPMQAAGKALASMGDLGKEIALREQRAKDVRNGNSLLNDWSAYESEMKDRLAEAVTSEEAAGFKEEIKAKHKEMIGRLGDIGSDEYSDELRAKLGISAAINEIQVDTSSRRLLVNETRFEVRQAAKNAMMKKIAAGDIEGGKAEVRRLFEQASGTAWSEAQVEAEVESATAGIGFLQAQADLASGNLKEIGSYGMTAPEMMRVKVQDISSKQRKGDSVNRYEISRGDDRAVLAAEGKWKGKNVGREEAKEKLMQSVEAMEFDSPVQKQEYIQSINSIFETQSIRNEMIRWSSENPSLSVPGLNAVWADVDLKTDELGPQAAEELKKEIETRIEAIESQEIKEDRSLEIERLKKEEKLLRNMELGVREAIENAERTLRNPESGENAIALAREAAIKGVSEATGIGPGIHHDEYGHGPGTYFRVKDMAQPYLHEFLEKAPKQMTRQQMHWQLGTGGDKSTAALEQLGNYYVDSANYDEPRDEHFLSVVNASETFADLEEEEQKALAAKVSEFGVLMHYSKEKGKLPPSIESWFNQLDLAGDKDRKHQVIRAGAYLAAAHDIDLEKLLPQVGADDRERMIKYASLEGRLEGEERFEEAMKVSREDQKELSESVAWLDANKRKHVNALLNRKSIDAPGKDEKMNLLTQAFMKRGFTYEESLEAGLLGNDHFLNLFAAESESVLRFSDPLEISQEAFTKEERGVIDEAYNRAVERYFGKNGKTSYATGGGERALVSYPVESNLPKIDGEYQTGPLVNSAIRGILELTDEQLSKMNAAGFPTKEIQAIRKEFGGKSTLLNQKGDFPGNGRIEAMKGIRSISEKIERGEATEDDLRDYMQSQEFYSKINDDDWTGATLSKAKGLALKYLKLNPTTAITAFSGEAVFKSDLPEDMEKFIRENFIIEATASAAPPEDVASANSYLEGLQSGLKSGSYEMPVGNVDRYKYSLMPAVGGVGIGVENPALIWFKKEDYETAETVELIISNTEKPQKNNYRGIYDLEDGTTILGQ